MKLTLNRILTPIGTILLVSDGTALRALDFADCEPRMHQLLRRYCGPHTLVEGRKISSFSSRVDAYFKGDFAALEQIPVRVDGTAFQRTIWAALREIPAGRTITYGHLAARSGRPKAARAVGLAMRSNPIAIVIPCHRVIDAHMRRTGYAGGLARKEWLLRHEANASRDPIMVSSRSCTGGGYATGVDQDEHV